MDEYIEKVKNILKDILNLKDIPDNACQMDFPEWDSLAYMSIIARLEKEFDLKVTQNNIQQFFSIENIMKEVRQVIK